MIDAKLDVYRDGGVPLIWIVNPPRKTVTVYRLGSDPQLFGSASILSGEPHLPGLSISVAELFVDVK